MNQTQQTLDDTLLQALAAILAQPVVQWALLLFGLGFAIDRLSKLGILPKPQEKKEDPKPPQIIVIPTHIQSVEHLLDQTQPDTIKGLREQLTADREAFMEYVASRFEAIEERLEEESEKEDTDGQ